MDKDDVSVKAAVENGGDVNSSASTIEENGGGDNKTLEGQNTDDSEVISEENQGKAEALQDDPKEGNARVEEEQDGNNLERNGVETFKAEEEKDDTEEVEPAEGDEEEEEEEEEDEEDEDEDEDDEPPKFKYSRLTNLPVTFFSRDPISTCTFHESIFIFATHSGILHITHSDIKVIRTFKAHRASILSVYTDGVFFGSASMDGTVVIGSILDEKDIIAYDFKRPIHAVVLDKNYKHARSFVTGGMSGKVIRSSKNWLGQRVDTVIDEGSKVGGPIVGIFQLQDLLLWMNEDGISVYHTTTKQKISTIERPPNSPRGDMYWPRVHFPEIDRIVIAWADHIWLLRVTGGNGAGTSSSNAGASIAGSGFGNGGGGSNSSKIFIPSSATISFRSGYSKAIEIEHVLKVDDCLIAGISTFKDDLCIILTFQPPTRTEDSPRPIFHNPELKLINTINGEIVFEEEIGLKDVTNLGLNDYHLGTHIGENSSPKFYLISAKDAVIAQEVSLKDQLEWFIENEKFYEAWKISEHLVDPIKRLNLGVSYADSLIKENRWEEIGNFLSKLLFLDSDKLPEGDTRSTLQNKSIKDENSTGSGGDEYIKEIVGQWDNWANIFIESGQYDDLVRIIPTSPKLGLSTTIYTSILEHYLYADDLTTFYVHLDAWDPELYSIKKIENIMEEKLEADHSNDRLRRYLSQLYVKSHQPINSVEHLVYLKDNNILEFLSTYHILTNFVDEIPSFIELRFNKEAGEIHKLPISDLQVQLNDIVELLVQNRHELPPKRIVDLMFAHHLDFINYFYIEKLSEIDEYLTRSFSNERILLYSQYDRSKLLGFLTKGSGGGNGGGENSNNYDIDKAIELCERNEFTEELVYLLGKIGENRKALMLIIDKLNDPEKAIKFAKHQNDEEAWTILLDYSMNKPAFIKALIELADDQSSSFYDPISIIRRIPKNVQVDGLKSSVTKISFNNDLNLVLNQLILKIIYKESEDISKNFRADKLLGVEIDIDDDEKFGERINWNSNIEGLLQQFETIVLYEEVGSSNNFGNKRKKMKLATLKDFFSERPEIKVPIVIKYSSLADKIEHLEKILDL